MVALQVSQNPAVTSSTANSPIPELSDDEYFLSVLQLPDRAAKVDDELLAKASSLGISTSVTDKRNTTSIESTSTVATYHARTFSILSNGSVSTALTNHSSLYGKQTPESAPSPRTPKRDSKDLSFTHYDRYLKQTDPQFDQQKFLRQSPTPGQVDPVAHSVLSAKSRRSFFSIKSGFKDRLRWRRKGPQPLESMLSCFDCQKDFKTAATLHNLPCGHTCCGDCLKSKAEQAIGDETLMPPRCCTQPLPGYVVREVLGSEAQQQFLKAVVQYGTPWELRIFCNNTSCGEFIPLRSKPDPKYPLDVTCRKCETRICTICRRNGHPTGKNCPEDWELDEMLKSSATTGWKRCYMCRSLVEVTPGSTRVTCRCKAELCHICGGVWELNAGCPNHCHSEEEMERRRVEEEALLAEYEAEKAAQEAAAAAALAERMEAETRSKNHSSFRALEKSHIQELQRFQDFIKQAPVDMSIRHAEEKKSLFRTHEEQEVEMQERHARNASNLEDRQVTAEMELRNTLEQSERSVNIRLKHMQAYCDGLSRGSTSDGKLPARTVTPRDLRELGQQYNLRDGMARLHASKINVMRDQQAKRMEELLDRQELEFEKLLTKQRQEKEEQVARFSSEEDALKKTFAERKCRLIRRWELAIEILQKELETQDGLKYGPIPTPEWPTETTTDQAGSAETNS